MNKYIVPIVAISFQDLIDQAPSEIPDLLSDDCLLDDLIIPLEDIKDKSDVAYLLVLSDHKRKIDYPAYVKRYEIKLNDSDDEEMIQIQFRKFAEYDHDSFQVEFRHKIPFRIMV